MALLLARRPDQAIEMVTSDGPITIMVMSIKENRVILGIDAPKSVAIYRDDMRNRR